MTVQQTSLPASALPDVRRLGVGSGTALCAGAVLGPGVLTLPSLAAAAAGPASILAWVVLLALCVPVAASFAALGARFPDGGGVATYVHRAIGPRAAAVVGWWFYGAVPIGVVSASWIGGKYVADAAGWGGTGAAVVAGAVVAVALVSNAVGLRLSGRVQLLLGGLLAVVLLGTVLAAAPQVSAAHFTPFMPGGWSSVGSAAVVLFFAFAGWEAASHLSGEFADPGRDLPRVTRRTLAVITVLYLGLAVATIGALGPAAAGTETPLTELLARSVGGAARPVAAVAALFLTFGAVNSYLAGASRLGAALARDGAAPRALAKERRAGRGAAAVTGGARRGGRARGGGGGPRRRRPGPPDEGHRHLSGGGDPRRPGRRAGAAAPPHSPVVRRMRERPADGGRAGLLRMAAADPGGTRLRGRRLSDAAAGHPMRRT
ncbi:APC family permease [Streptomyces sp. RPA4-5]|uniref:APC family permease n=1 Tax=Streptomyces sp. RPA4-5 TaxID=2721245 RepID=UPI002001E158|nr:APC family permease [Streptomyces sp. RPA4-5]